MSDETIHHRIPVLRAERGMSRRELAEAVGVHYQTIGYLERGEYSPSLALAFRIAAVFDLPLTEVFSDHPFPSLREVLAQGADRAVPPTAQELAR
jgi:putative transcriptional regulator